MAATVSHVLEQTGRHNLRPSDLLDMTVEYVALLIHRVEVKVAKLGWLEGSLHICVQRAEARLHDVECLSLQNGFRLPDASDYAVRNFLMSKSTTIANLVAHLRSHNFKEVSTKLPIQRLVDAIGNVSMLMMFIEWHNILLGGPVFEAQRVGHRWQSKVG